jgi:hypothetical protein
MTNFVFFNAVDAEVKVTVNDTVVGYADTAAGLVELFLQNNLTHNDTFMHSSDVDFASEEGFASDDAAHELIDEAMEQAALV